MEPDHGNNTATTFPLDLLVEATRKDLNLRMGISPRGSIALFRSSQAFAAISGRDYVTPEDIQELLLPVFISRILPRSTAILKGLDAKQILLSIIEQIPAPQLN